ncbi:hypothetical protein CO165_04300 [Candidatus Roizmanbacteria bacterium CG_4_9_14_3_um_filter_33_18]|uniref:Bacterial spore germination immunoglobulin-like domain-containing protein n=3 Tax=Candidatus Roizmaniibacteriota TaxID=1752723 RepID=A0A2M7U9V5_9BACT|nr:MAG: hypothetical protein COW97_03595 [Candidatus Roizmanbacteria bacterium CG22_combo_CG10-13_8_21_14_all_34_12]PIZ68008.1 MAG: hypothetical protein COY12_00850 [Candidatus Roizmanbacteria bacterium CG_4_10_14_0_2_um_filter_33_96]PJA55299.1 MAG: hypothetical protein CO165_04300 [Candidatus Roizmanbacteria bacterium CG_4_9_14_3_um_filter_33_18]
MKKETIIAIFLGLLFGGVVAVFISLKSKDIELSTNKVIAPSKEKILSPNLTGTEIQTLELSEPVNNAIFEKDIIRFKGTAAKNSLIIIQSPIKDLVVKNIQGKFNLEFPLALGENSIKIVVYPKEKQFKPQEKFIKVYYIDSEL